MICILAQILAFISAISIIDGAYYLPGVTPHAYQQQESVSVLAYRMFRNNIFLILISFVGQTVCKQIDIYQDSNAI